MHRNFTQSSLFRLALIAGSALVTPAAAFAQSAPAADAEASANDIVVTGTKRNATIQDVPFSINAQTQEDIEKTGAVTLEALAARALATAAFDRHHDGGELPCQQLMLVQP